MGAHFSSKHYRRKLTMISKVAVLCVFATLAQAAPEAQWLGHAPVAYAAPDCAHSTQDLVAKSCPRGCSCCPSRCRDCQTRMRLSHHQTLCPITHLCRCAYPNHQMPRRREG